MIARALAVAALATATVFVPTGTAGAKNACLLARAIQRGAITRDANGFKVYEPGPPVADDYEACGLPVPAIAVREAPVFTG